MGVSNGDFTGKGPGMYGKNGTSKVNQTKQRYAKDESMSSTGYNKANGGQTKNINLMTVKPSKGNSGVVESRLNQGKDTDWKGRRSDG